MNKKTPHFFPRFFAHQIIIMSDDASGGGSGGGPPSIIIPAAATKAFDTPPPTTTKSCIPTVSSPRATRKRRERQQSLVRRGRIARVRGRLWRSFRTRQHPRGNEDDDEDEDDREHHHHQLSAHGRREHGTRRHVCGVPQLLRSDAVTDGWGRKRATREPRRKRKHTPRLRGTDGTSSGHAAAQLLYDGSPLKETQYRNKKTLRFKTAPPRRRAKKRYQSRGTTGTSGVNGENNDHHENAAGVVSYYEHHHHSTNSPSPYSLSPIGRTGPLGTALAARRTP